MKTGSYLIQETKTILNSYQPIYTEVDGIKDLATGIYGLAGSLIGSLGLLIESNNFRKDIPIALLALQICGDRIAEGLIKLSVPIIISTGYLVSRNYP